MGALRVLACPSRTRIFQVLQGKDGFVPVDEIAGQVDLHVNTTREHLDRLVASGFVEREVEHRTTRGRPRILYRAVSTTAVSTVDGRARGHLTRVLLDGYGKALPSPAASAESAGVAWASELGCPGAGSSTDPEADLHGQVAALRGHFEELGFELEVDLEAMQIRLTRCPFADLARRRSEVVCGAHLGLAKGVLARHEGPLTVDRMEKLDDPHRCVLHLVKV